MYINDVSIHTFSEQAFLLESLGLHVSRGFKSLNDTSGPSVAMSALILSHIERWQQALGIIRLSSLARMSSNEAHCTALHCAALHRAN